MRTVLVTLGILLLLAALAVTAGYWWTSRSGTAPAAVTQWVGEQLQTIANWYLNPTLEFDDLTYQYPGTVTVKNVRLQAQDPADPARSITILGAEEMTLELAQVPQLGKPIVMQRIILKRPVFRAIADGPGSARLIGFSNLLKSTEAKKGQTEPAGVKLSEIFQMRLVQIVDGRFVYDPRIAGRPAMELDQVSMRLDLEQSGGGWYTLRTSLKRPPTMALSIAGQLNLDSLSAKDLALDLKADLAPGQEKYLPPELQKLLKDHDVKGVLSARVAGEGSIADWRTGRLHVEALLTDANISVGEHRFPVDRLSLAADLADRRLSISSLQLNALHGQTNLSGDVALNENVDSNLNLRVRDALLQDTLRKQATADALPKYAGKVNADVEIHAPLAAVARSALRRPGDAPPVALPANWGGGTVSIAEGRLVNIPALRSLAEALSKAAKVTGLGGDAMNDRADLRFTCGGEAVQFSDIKVVGSYLAVRGSGQVMLDQRLDLKLTGGPLDKAASLLGQSIGNAFSNLTSGLAAYYVTGTLRQPQVRVEVAGGSIGKAADDAGDAVGEGAKKVGDAIRGLFR